MKRVIISFDVEDGVIYEDAMDKIMTRIDNVFVKNVKVSTVEEVVKDLREKRDAGGPFYGVSDRMGHQNKYNFVIDTIKEVL